MAGMLRGECTEETSQRPGTARAASHFLLMTSYVAGVVQKSLMEMEKHHNGISRVVFYILLLRLVW